MDELALIESAKNGDYGAFELLVKLHYRSVYNMAYRYMKDPGRTEDVVQDSFIKAHKSIATFRGDSKFKSWLLRITSNTALNAIRSNKRHQGSSLDKAPLGYVHEGFEEAENSQSRQIIKEAVSTLPEKQRLAVELRVFEELSFKQIAEVMNCPFDTAKANYRHGLMKLKKILLDKKQDLRGF